MKGIRPLGLKNFVRITTGIKFLGLLANHDSMTLERIYAMLKMLFSGTGDDVLNRIDMNILSLRKFLAGMVETDKIDLVDNRYMSRKGVGTSK